MKRLIYVLTLVLALCVNSYASDLEGIWMAETPFGAAFISVHETAGTVVGIWLDPRWEWEAMTGFVEEGAVTTTLTTALGEDSEPVYEAELLNPNSIRATQISCTPKPEARSPKPEGECDFPDGTSMTLTKVF